MTPQQMLDHFAALGLDIKIKQVIGDDDAILIEYLGGKMPAHRLPSLLEVYFFVVEPIEFGECEVAICNFKPDGYGYAGICKRCGCQQHDACMSEDGPCWWVDIDLCSTCASKEELQEVYDNAESKIVEYDEDTDDEEAAAV